MRNISLIFFHSNRAALKLENFASLLQGRQRHNVTGQNACSLPAAAPCGWGFKIHLSVSQWPQTQLGGCGGGGSAKCHREEHLLACPTARAWREGKEPGWCGQRRPLRRRHLQLPGPGDPAANLRSGRGLGRGRPCTSQGFSTPSSRGNGSGRLLRACMYFKECQKGNISLPTFLPLWVCLL